MYNCTFPKLMVNSNFFVWIFICNCYNFLKLLSVILLICNDESYCNTFVSLIFILILSDAFICSVDILKINDIYL